MKAFQRIFRNEGGANENLVMRLFLPLAFFLGVFFFYTRPIFTITDFWWHISSGRWIYDNLALPSMDPFAFTSAPPDARGELILRGYWLSQVIFYLVYEAAGFHGLIVLKATSFVLTYFILWKSLLFHRVPSSVGLCLIAPVVYIATPFEELRPQVSSFFCALLLFLVLERGMHELREERSVRPATLMTAPFVMLLWANLHRGYVIGVTIISVYLFSEIVKYLSGKSSFSRGNLLRFAVWAGVSALASMMNPSFFQAIPVIIDELRHHVTIVTIDEFSSPWEYALYSDKLFFFVGLVGVGIVTLLIMSRSWRSLELRHILLYVGFAAAAFRSFRFSIFFVLMAVAIAGRYAGLFFRRGFRVPRVVATSLVACAIMLFASYAWTQSSVRQRITHERTLKNAVDFILAHELPGPLFNPFEWGGYLMWRMYPQYQVFVDARALDARAYRDYLTAASGRKGAVFQRHGVRTVIFYLWIPKEDRMPALIYSLLRDKAWRLVYYDDDALVFVESGSRPDVPALDKESYTDTLIGKIQRMSERSPEDIDPYLILGQLYYVKDDLRTAKTYFEQALRLKPDDTFALRWLSVLKERFSESGE
jgi:hypothetical protein